MWGILSYTDLNFVPSLSFFLTYPYSLKKGM